MADDVMGSSLARMAFPISTFLYDKFARSPEAIPAATEPAIPEPAGIATTVPETGVGPKSGVVATPIGLNGYVASPKTQMAAANGIVATGIIGAGNETDMNPVTEELSAQTQIASSQLDTLRLIASQLSSPQGSVSEIGGPTVDSPMLSRKLNTSLPKGAMAYSAAAQQSSGAAGNPTSYGV
jgi:hypothetical protein